MESIQQLIKKDPFKQMYPFSSHYVQLGDVNMHYIDENSQSDDVVLMLHGNPTWSFYYRNLVKALVNDGKRVIVPDHIGCGLSDKPQDYPYTLEQRIKDIEKLLHFLNIKKAKLVVHDWGGAIGFGVATRQPSLFEKIVILNSAAFTSSFIPWQIQLCKNKFFGDFITKYLNAFAWPATFMASKKGLTRYEKKCYLAPYQNVAQRIAISEFVQDIPMTSTHPTFSTLKAIEDKLSEISCPKLILWGGKDFCFHDIFYNKWREIYPQALFYYFDEAGHYVLEDCQDEVLAYVKDFFA